MTSSRPYLIRAIHEWLLDNELTPYIMVDVMAKGVEVPEAYIEDGKIILNISPIAVRELLLDNQYISFEARFSGITHAIYVPVPSVMAIYAFENGRGMVFDDDSDGDDTPPPSGSDDDDPRPSGPPKLKIVH